MAGARTLRSKSLTEKAPTAGSTSGPPSPDDGCWSARVNLSGGIRSWKQCQHRDRQDRRGEGARDLLRVLEGYPMPRVVRILSVDRDSCEASLSYAYVALPEALMSAQGLQKTEAANADNAP